MRTPPMPIVLVLLTWSVLVASSICRAEQYSEVYPGRFTHKKLVAKNHQSYILATLVPVVDHNVAFQFKWFEKRMLQERSYFEKVVVTRERKDEDDPGDRAIVPDEYVEGPLDSREENVEIGPLMAEEVDYLGACVMTDGEGILVDGAQLVLALFDDLRERSRTIRFQTQNHGALDVVVTRDELNKRYGIHYDSGSVSVPENIGLRAAWSQEQFQPGDRAELTLTVRNTGTRGNVRQLLARSMSRWPWLDGRMFYIGDLAPGEERVFTRVFHLPPEMEAATYYLRVGARDYSGAKRQAPLCLKVCR